MARRRREKTISHGNQFLFVSLNWQQFETSLCKLWACSWNAKFSTMLLNYSNLALLLLFIYLFYYG